MSCDKNINQLKIPLAHQGIPEGVAMWAKGRASKGHCPDCGAFLDKDGVCHNQTMHAEVGKARVIATAIRQAGGQAYFVGGYVRDTLLGRQSNDLDIVVGGLERETLHEILGKFGEVVADVGNQYAVSKLRINGDELDFAHMRRERSSGAGYHDVKVTIGKDVALKDDAARRDITINAIYQDVINGTYIDPHGGMQDIIDGTIRHTSPRFVESNERPLRLSQINARNPDFQIAQETIELCKTMTGQFNRIPKEQLRQQFHKMLVKGKRPSKGIKALKDMGYLPLFPALNALAGCPQDPRYHPEGDALVHTGQVCDAMAVICERESITGDRRFKMMLAAMCHDLGKPETTVITDAEITSPDHQNHTDAAEAFLEHIDVPKKMRPAILALTREHMAHINEPTPRSVRRLARRLSNVTDSQDFTRSTNIDELCLLMEADMSGRTADGSATPIGARGNIAKLKTLAAESQVSKGKPADILMGRHLISELGMNPKTQGRRMGEILRATRQAQDDGLFDDLSGAVSFAKTLLLEA